ncbi:MAG TPA: glycosyltransferase family 1 protein [Burkholderiaceae bacterium]|nr:glycosyltransferase family 1 protein [Burkholderiaceae bacterium]
MPPLLIDITRLLSRLLQGRLATGVDRVDLAYVQHYGPRARAVVRVRGRSLVLSRQASQKVFARLLAQSEGLSWSIVSETLRGVLATAGRQDVAGALLLNTGHSGLHQPAYARQLRGQGLHPVFMVHDLIPITHHEFCRAGEREKHIVRMHTVLDTAAGVITNSQATLDQLAAFARRAGKAMPPARAALLAPAVRTATPGARPLAEPYFVVLGTIEPRKNHWLLLQAWRRLAERLGSATPRLVVIGQRGWECENVVDLLERCEPLRGLVVERRSCTDAELVTWLHHAQALLFPSFVEGYGLPLVEALAQGVPVIASDLPVFREIAGQIPEYVDPLDGPAWLEQVERYAAPGSRWRKAQLERLSGFVAPSWGGHFEAVDSLLEQVERDRRHG